MHINNSFTYTFKAAIHHEEVKNMYKSTGPTHAKFHSQIPYLSILLANMLRTIFILFSLYTVSSMILLVEFILFTK